MNKKIIRAVYLLVLTAFIMTAASVFVSAKETAPAKAKNVILYIADGTGPQAMGLLIQYARLAPQSIYGDKASSLEKLMRQASLGLMLTNSKLTITIDSAAAATQFASGVYSLPQRVGVDFSGKPVITMLEKAKKQGKSTGLVTTTHIQDATPASFAAHQITRKNLAEISADLIKSGTDIMLGGGKQYFPQNLIDEARGKGYNFAFNKSELASLNGKIIGLFGEHGTPYAIEHNTAQPGLTEMSKKALAELEKNKKGFFVMIEAGKPDWAAHSNDAGLLLHELIEFDKTLQYLMDYVKKNKDTLLIVTADHETGGFGFSYRKEMPQDNQDGVYGGTYYVTFDTLDRLYRQKMSYEEMDKEYNALAEKEKTDAALAKILSKGLDRKITADFVASHKNDIQKIKTAIEKEDGIVWASGNHTSTPILVMAYGSKNAGYTGLYTEVGLAKRIIFSLGLK
jgi:alkaline phosphatase